MRNPPAVVCLLAVISAAPALRAKDDRPKFEVYGSYNYVRFNVESKVNGLPPSLTFNGNGGGGELVYDINRWLGVLGDTGGYWATNSTRQGAAIRYLFGPRAVLRRGTITPFVQQQVGRW